jgi:hypothetical protein
MLRPLCSGDQCKVCGRIVLFTVFLHNFLSFLDKALHALADLARGVFSSNSKHSLRRSILASGSARRHNVSNEFQSDSRTLIPRRNENPN